jgi:hypothetical protein
VAPNSKGGTDARAQSQTRPALRSSRRHWLKIKNPDAPAVRREAEEDWGAISMKQKARLDKGRRSERGWKPQDGLPAQPMIERNASIALITRADARSLILTARQTKNDGEKWFPLVPLSSRQFRVKGNASFIRAGAQIDAPRYRGGRPE